VSSGMHSATGKESVQASPPTTADARRERFETARQHVPASGPIADEARAVVEMSLDDQEGVLVVRGALVVRAVGSLLQAVHTALDGGVRRLTFDLRDVTEVDPAGLAPLVIATRRLRAVGGAVRFVAVSTPCLEVMRRLHVLADAAAGANAESGAVPN
jgi:ABC-type transporter Mla MlaB component